MGQSTWGAAAGPAFTAWGRMRDCMWVLDTTESGYGQRIVWSARFLQLSPGPSRFGRVLGHPDLVASLWLCPSSSSPPFSTFGRISAVAHGIHTARPRAAPVRPRAFPEVARFVI